MRQIEQLKIRNKGQRRSTTAIFSCLTFVLPLLLPAIAPYPLACLSLFLFSARTPPPETLATSLQSPVWLSMKDETIPGCRRVMLAELLPYFRDQSLRSGLHLDSLHKRQCTFVTFLVTAIEELFECHWRLTIKDESATATCMIHRVVRHTATEAAADPKKQLQWQDG